MTEFRVQGSGFRVQDSHPNRYRLWRFSNPEPRTLNPLPAMLLGLLWFSSVSFGQQPQPPQITGVRVGWPIATRSGYGRRWK